MPTDLNPREHYGQLFFNDNNIESLTPDIDIVIGLTTSTGRLKLDRDVVLASGKTLKLVDHNSPYAEVPLSVQSGVLVAGAGGLGFRVGNIELYQDTIESTAGSVDFKLGSTSATANLIIGRNVVHAAGKSIAFSGVAGTQTTPYLGTATLSQIGGVKPDGTSITISNGIISSVGGSGYTFTSTTQNSTLTVDMTSGPSVIFWQPTVNGNRSITLTNFTAGKSVKLWITPHQSGNTFTFTGVTGTQCSNNSNTFRLASGGAGQSSMMMEIFSTTTDVGGVWIFAHDGV